jgi:hypothetical protein
MVLLTVVLCNFTALVAHVLLKRWIDNKLFCNRVASELPGELIAKTVLMVMVVRVDNFVVALFQFLMVFDDGV